MRFPYRLVCLWKPHLWTPMLLGPDICVRCGHTRRRLT